MQLIIAVTGVKIFKIPAYLFIKQQMSIGMNIHKNDLLIVYVVF